MSCQEETDNPINSTLLATMSSIDNLLDVHADDLTRLVFIENHRNKTYALCLGGVETSKDLFFFMLDLLCKGLVFLYGNGEPAIDLAEVTTEQFQNVGQKLACAGIIVHLKTEMIVPVNRESNNNDNDTNNEPKFETRINMPQLLSMPANSPLESFVLEICMESVGVRHLLNFSLTHNI